MKTWKSKKTVCRSRKSGKFSPGGKCRAFKRTLIRAVKSGSLFAW